MYTTAQIDNGVLNNSARDPQVYFADTPSDDQRIRYAQQGAVAVLFVTSLLLVAFSVS